MTIRRVLAGALVLVGGFTLLLTVLGMLGGNGALAPFALLGLVLSGAGVRLLPGPRRARATSRGPHGGHAVGAHHAYAAPTGDVGSAGVAERCAARIGHTSCASALVAGSSSTGCQDEAAGGCWTDPGRR
jgi:hypothetical protein